MRKYLPFLLLFFAPFAHANYCTGNVTGNSINDSQVDQCVKLAGTWTLATLPTHGMQIGDTAYVTDNGGEVVVFGSSGWVVVGGGSGGGGVTSVATGPCLTGGPITTTGTVSGTQVINAQTGTSYAVLTTDACSLLTFSNSAAVAVSLSAATTTGFTAGFSFDVQNKGNGAVTITPATSTINGAATLVVPKNSGCTITSDGANYQVSACSAIAPFSNGTVTSVSGGQNISVATGTTTPVINNTATSQANTTNTSATLTAAQILNVELDRSGPTAAYTDTTPAASAVVAGYTGAAVGSSFWLLYRNTVAFTATIAAGGNATLDGATTVAPSSTGLFLGIINNIGSGTEAYTLYGLGLNVSSSSANSVLANATGSAAPQIPTTSPVVNRWNLSGSTTTASGTGLQGCSASNCAALSSGGQFAFEAGVDKHGDFTNSLGAPTCTTCGSGGTIAGGDQVGRVTLGTTPGTTVTITFKTAFTNAPVCNATDEATGVVGAVTSVSTAAVTFTFTALAAANTVGYNCMAYQ